MTRRSLFRLAAAAVASPALAPAAVKLPVVTATQALLMEQAAFPLHYIKFRTDSGYRAIAGRLGASFAEARDMQAADVFVNAFVNDFDS